MTHSKAHLASLDLAVSAAALAWQEAIVIVGEGGCGVLFPFGTDGDALCPACKREVYTHLGFPKDAS